MSKVVNVSRTKWIKYKPERHLDIRNVPDKFWSIRKAREEREKRIRILENGNEQDQHLALILKTAKKKKPAPVACCPLAARQFQIFVVARAMELEETLPRQAIAATLLIEQDAVPYGQLHTVDWRKLHHRLRQQIERAVGPSVVVIGVGEVEADDTRHCWQPHYHLVIYGVTKRELGAIRQRHFPSKRGEPRRMVMRIYEDGNWLAYAAKLTAFRKVENPSKSGNPIVRKRLRVAEFREHMRYVASSNPTQTLFCMNCSLARASRKKVLGKIRKNGF